MRTLPTPVFFYGMAPQDQISVEIDPGKTLEIRLQAIGETSDEGEVKVFFELNGQPRTTRVPNRAVASKVAKQRKAEDGNADQVGSPMPGTIASVAVKAGASVNPGDVLFSIEAMKMETAIHADRKGVVSAIHVQPGAAVEAKDLLLEFEAE